MWLLIVINMSIFHRKEFLFYYRHFSISDVGRYVFPLSLAMMGAKYLTYKSCGMIPVSLTHTVKALQPFFNVLIVFLWTGNTVDIRTFLSLFPIIIGVSYASVKEIEWVVSYSFHPRFELVGFVCALLSTIIGVWQGIYLKMLMRTGLQKNFVATKSFNYNQIHLCNATISSILLFPLVLYMEYSNSSFHHIHVKGVLLSALLQYLSSISSYSVFNRKSSHY